MCTCVFAIIASLFLLQLLKKINSLSKIEFTAIIVLMYFLLLNIQLIACLDFFFRWGLGSATLVSLLIG